MRGARRYPFILGISGLPELLEHLALQAAAGAAVIVAVLAAVIISAIFYGMQRRSISEIKKSLQPLRTIDPKIQYDVSRIDAQLRTTCEDLTNIRTSVPHTNEITTIQQNMQNLCADFSDLKSRMEDDMDRFKRGTTEDLDKTRREMTDMAAADFKERVERALEASVSREEFDLIKTKIEKLAGSDEAAERMEELTSLFDSKQIKTINWQCKLIKLLRGGLAPDAEEDRIMSEGIPMTGYKTFLKKLVSEKFVERKDVSAFYMYPDREWLYSYVDNPDWLQKNLEAVVKKEKEYQEYLRHNLSLVEEGLLLVSSEYQLDTGKIDFLCRDRSGRDVGLELKYPAATTNAKRQVSGYRDDYARKTGRGGARFILVSPRMPDKLKGLLREDGLEYREIPFSDDPSA